jgi:3-deoxy-7-phosphoheptulonate synthase
MQRQTDDVRISEIKELLPPIAHLYELPITETASEVIYTTRKDIAALLRGEDDRLLVVIGPCSIHDTDAAIEYARKLQRCATAWPASWWW